MSESQSFIERFIKNLKSASEYLPTVREILAQRKDIPDLSLNTLSCFNRKIWGIKKGLTIIGGRVSQGKSSLALQIAYDLATQFHPVLFLSLEMTVENLLERLFCQVMEVSNFDLLTGKIEIYEDKWQEFIGKMNIPFKISCGIGKDFEEINQTLELLNPKPEVIILDYIQAIRNMGDERQNLNEYIRKFREICIENDIAGILCSQISRKIFEEGNHEPTLFNLKGTGCIHPNSIVEGRTIKEISINKLPIKIASYNIEKNKAIKIIPSHYVHTGKKKCLKIKTKSGKEIILSKGTKLFDGQVWRKAKTFLVGEKILVDFLGMK